MWEKIRNALFISTVAPTLPSGKMGRNTKADAAVEDIVVRKKCKAFNSYFVIKVMHFINLYFYLYLLPICSQY